MSDVRDSETANLDHVWKPIKVGVTTLKHRILHTATTLLYAEDNILSDRHIAYYRERAMGGAALMITEQQAAYPVAKGSFHQGCTAYDKRAIPQYAKLAEAVHEFGARQFVQLYGTGVHDKGTMMIDEWHPLWAASRVASPVHHEIPLEMEQQHIDEVIAGFAQSAENIKVAGIDGIEVSAAHSYLLGQFLSPAYNRRTDKYGGNPRKRCQLVIEIADAIRARIGRELTFGLRMSYDEFLGDAGITQEQAEEQLSILADTGLFDFFNISGGAYQTLAMTVGPMTVPEGFMIPFGKSAKDIVGDRAKVFVAGRIRDIHMADQAIADGAADMVAMTRMQLADPQFINKTREGRAHEVTQCMGSNECVARAFDNREVVCLMNPITGRERKWGAGKLKLVADNETKQILVVGGGPAGMKFAAVAARRGHAVTLVEQRDSLGGHLVPLSSLPTRGDWNIAINNLEREMSSNGVDIRLNTTADADYVRAAAPDAVVIATGSTWDTNGYSLSRAERGSIPGAESDHVVDLETAINKAKTDPLALGQRVLIIDESSLYEPLGLAEVLATAGVSVEVVSPELFIGNDVMRHLEMPHLFPRLAALGVKMTSQTFVERIDGADIEVYGIWGGPHEIRRGVDTVVLSMGRTPREDLYFELKQWSTEVHRIGDALAPRKTPAVIYDGEELGRVI